MAGSIGLRRGIDLINYRNTGTFGTPVWFGIPNVRDQTLGNKRTKIDASYRGFAPFMAKVGGLIDFNPTFEMLFDYSDVNVAAILAAYYATTPSANQIEFAFSDGVITGANVRYIRAIMSIFDVSENQPLDDVDKLSIDLSPTYNPNSPPLIVLA